MCYSEYLVNLYRPSSAGHAQIGDYPELLDICDPNVNECPLKCGYGRESELMDDSCFEWHKSETQPNLKNGRRVTSGEMPYVVFIAIMNDTEM